MPSNRDRSKRSKTSSRQGKRPVTLQAEFERLLEQSNYKEPFWAKGRISKYKKPIHQLFECMKLYVDQRDIDYERVNAYVAYQIDEIKMHGYPLFPGEFTVCQVEGIEKWELIDGQHRFKATKILFADGYFSDFKNFLFEIHVIHVKTMDDVHKEFVNINKSVPVPDNVLQPNQIVNGAIEILSEKYSNPFTTSVKAKRPQIYGDGFKDYLIEQEVVDMLDIDTAEELASLIVRTNNRIKLYGVPELRRQIKGNSNEHKLIERLYERCTKENRMHLSIFKARNPDKRGLWMKIMENLPQKGKEREKEE